MYLLLIVVTLAIGFGAQAYVNRQIKKYSYVPISNGMTGYQVAVGMLNYYGIYDVPVRMGRPGENFFNPKDNSITLDPQSFNGSSITATATAVSYTHLDVYKRQALYLPLLFIPLWFPLLI